MCRKRRFLSKLYLPVVTVLASSAMACVEDEGNPSVVEDLRVLAISLERPEVMAPSCDFASPEALSITSTEVQFRALLVDPKGAGRELGYELRACATSAQQTADSGRLDDVTCEAEGETVLLASGTTAAGELTLALRPAEAMLPDGTPLLLEVLERDKYRGLGGIRMPLQLRVSAGDEEVRAEKLMVFSCRYFPEMQENVTPVLPGVKLEGTPWGPDEVREVSGAGPFLIEAEDFSALEEPYVVPSFELQPVNLKESWKISWFTTFGEMAPTTSGGTDFDGVGSPNATEWTLDEEEDTAPGLVDFWFVVRDGRGGTSWLTRRAQYLGR